MHYIADAAPLTVGILKQGYIDGYDRGFELDFDRGIEHFCKQP
jgi:hypothetical protein